MHDSGRIVGGSEVIQLGIVWISTEKSASARTTIAVNGEEKKPRIETVCDPLNDLPAVA
jgi:hypothetical protein